MQPAIDLDRVKMLLDVMWFLVPVSLISDSFYVAELHYIVYFIGLTR